MVNPRCPECGSERVQGHGTRRSIAAISQRWRCTKCGHTFQTDTAVPVGGRRR